MFRSLYNKTNCKNFEVILVDNGSVEEDSFDMLNYYQNKYDNF